MTNDFEEEEFLLNLMSNINMAIAQEILPTLRQIQFEYSKFTLHLDCYYDGLIGYEEFISITRIAAELDAQYFPQIEISYKIHRIDFPLPIPKKDLKFGGYCYARKEKLETYNFRDQISALMLPE